MLVYFYIYLICNQKRSLRYKRVNTTVYTSKTCSIEEEKMKKGTELDDVYFIKYVK